MGLPFPVGTSVTGSLVVDAASYVWSQWAPCGTVGGLIQTWRLTNNVNTACYWSMFVADSQGSTSFVSSAALNGAGAQIVGADYSFDMEARTQMAAGTGLYYNFRPSATTTVRKFWVSSSISENNV